MRNLMMITSVLILMAPVAIAQNGIGIGTQSPHTSALLDVSSTTKGLLVPRMTTAQRNAIVTPAPGLMVYDTDTKTPWFHSGSAWASAAAGGGTLILPYTGSLSAAGSLFNITNTGTGTAISATASNTSTPAIRGQSDALGGYGVFGSSSHASGYGIAGSNPTGTAVYGFSASGGTALRGISIGGNALLTSGNLRLYGGNTNPLPGAVLTSVDADGNAVWKPKKIAFSVHGRHASYTTIPHNTTRTIHFSAVDYDYGQNFNKYDGGTPTSSSSTFQVPVNGLYHFDLKVALELIDPGYTDDFTEIIGTLRRTRAGNTIDVAVLDAGCCMEKDWKFFLYGGFDIPLLTGDLISMQVTQRNDASIAAAITFPMTLSGHLVFAD